LGKRIHRKSPNQPSNVPADTAAADSITYRRVVTVTSGTDEPEMQPGRTSDNALSFAWDESGREVQQATSGIRFTADQPSAMTVGLSWDSDGLSTNVRLANTSSEPLRVDGSVILEIMDSGTVVSTLASEPVDVVLAPGGEAIVTYRYLLPSGEYTLSSTFQR
jgi:hypothetical protein